MKLLPRRESVIAVILTSAVAVVTILWMMSYLYSLTCGVMRTRDNWQQRHQTFWGIFIQRGQVGVGRSRNDVIHSPNSAARQWDVYLDLIVRAHGAVGSGSPWASWSGTTSTDTPLGRVGFEVVNSTTAPWVGTVRADHAILVPWWAVFLLTLAVTLRWTFFRERRLLWRSRNRCFACGYDLRESRERCPERGLGTGPSTKPESMPLT